MARERTEALIGEQFCIRTITRPCAPSLPRPRGPLSAECMRHLSGPPHSLPAFPHPANDEDAALALYVMYELHYRGFDGVDDGWEWEPTLLRERARLERAFERQLRELVGTVHARPEHVAPALLGLARDGDGPSLSGWFVEQGTVAHMREFAIHRSAYQRKEADPHTWAIPRLDGEAKAALIEIQHGEYGDGRAAQMHSELFADTMRALQLDDTYGAYLDVIPAVTLTTVNLMSFFGLHRRWRGALVGHLALFEMCSVVPMRRYAATLRRLGVPDGAPFYDVHVDADARHEVIALRDMAVALATDEPPLAADIVFGARALAAVEARFAQSLISAWGAGRSSLLPC
jgi:Iron-containing redox enzyme